jgi:hypothetical protein
MDDSCSATIILVSFGDEMSYSYYEFLRNLEVVKDSNYA